MARARGAYRMTPKRRAALRKAQAASARKRRGRRTKIAAGVGIGVVLGAGVLRHKASGSSIKVMSRSSLRTGELKTTTTHKPVTFNEAGFRTGGGAVTHRGVVGTPTGNFVSVGRSGVRVGIGSKKIVYNHKPLLKARKVVTGTKVPGRVDPRDAGPAPQGIPGWSRTSPAVEGVISGSGSVPSRVLKPFVPNATTMTGVKHPFAVAIMAEEKRSRRGTRRIPRG